MIWIYFSSKTKENALGESHFVSLLSRFSKLQHPMPENTRGKETIYTRGVVNTGKTNRERDQQWEAGQHGTQLVKGVKLSTGNTLRDDQNKRRRWKTIKLLPPSALQFNCSKYSHKKRINLFCKPRLHILQTTKKNPSIHLTFLWYMFFFPHKMLCISHTCTHTEANTQMAISDQW